MARLSRRAAIILASVFILLFIGIGIILYVCINFARQTEHSVKSETIYSSTTTESNIHQANTKISISPTAEEHQPPEFKPKSSSSQNPVRKYQDDFLGDTAALATRKITSEAFLATMRNLKENLNKIFTYPENKNKSHEFSRPTDHTSSFNETLLSTNQNEKEEFERGTENLHATKTGNGQTKQLAIPNSTTSNDDDMKENTENGIFFYSKDNITSNNAGRTVKVLKDTQSISVNKTGPAKDGRDFFGLDSKEGKWLRVKNCKSRGYHQLEKMDLGQVKLKSSVSQNSDEHLRKYETHTADKDIPQFNRPHRIDDVIPSIKHDPKQREKRITQHYEKLSSSKTSNMINESLQQKTTHKTSDKLKKRNLIAGQKKTRNLQPEITEFSTDPEDEPKDIGCWSHDQCSEGRLCYDGWCVQRAMNSDSNSVDAGAGAVRAAQTHNTRVPELHHGDIMNLNPLITREEPKIASLPVGTVATTRPIPSKGDFVLNERPEDMVTHVTDLFTLTSTEAALQQMESTTDKSGKEVSNSNVIEKSINTQFNQNRSTADVLQTHRSAADASTVTSNINVKLKNGEKLDPHNLPPQLNNFANDSEYKEIQRNKRRDSGTRGLSNESVLLGVVLSVAVILLFLVVSLCCLCYCLHRQRQSDEQRELITRTKALIKKGGTQMTSNSDMESGLVRSRPPSYRTLAPPDYSESKLSRHLSLENTCDTTSSILPATSLKPLHTLNNFSSEKRVDVSHEREMFSSQKQEIDHPSMSMSLQMPKRAKERQGQSDGNTYDADKENDANNTDKKYKIWTQASVEKVHQPKRMKNTGQDSVLSENLSSASRVFGDEDPLQKLAEIIQSRRGSNKNTERSSGLANIAEQRDCEEKELPVPAAETASENSNGQNRANNPTSLAYEADFSSFDSFSSDGQDSVPGAGYNEIRADVNSTHQMSENIYEEVCENDDAAAKKIEAPIYENFP